MLLPSAEERLAGHAPVRFVMFLALMTSVAAMSIDLILPALDAIASDLGIVGTSDRGLLVLLLLAGMGIGQPVFGPIADAFGRIPAAAIGWGIYTLGTLLALVSTEPWMILAGRLLQGFGAAGPRVVAMAMVRDLYTGDAMARMLSIVLTIFMLVPILAPLLGQAIEAVAGWRALFVFYLLSAGGTLAWHLLSVPETLAPEDRSRLRFWPVLRAYGEVVTTRTSMLYTAAMTLTFGSFIAYLATSQYVFEEIYSLGALFPIMFAVLAIAFGAAQITNGRLVMRFGMRRLSRIAVAVMTGSAAMGLAMTQIPVIGSVPPVWLFVGSLIPVFFAAAILFANLNALALEPLGHIAGTASAALLSISTLGSVVLGSLLSNVIDMSVVPLYAGFTTMGIGAFLAFHAAEASRAE